MLKKVPHNDYHVPTHTCLNSSHECCCRTWVAISSFDSLMIVISLFCVTRHTQDLCIYHVIMMSYSPIIRRRWTDRLYMQLTKICNWVSHISPTFVYIIPMYLRLTTFTKTLPPNVISPKRNCVFFRSGAPPMTLLTAGALTDPHLPATASNVCTTDVRLGGVGRVARPNKNPGYAGA